MGLRPTDVTDARQKYAKVFDKSPSECFDRTLQYLKSINAVITQLDKKHYFVVADQFGRIFKQSLETTGVGILVRPSVENKAEILVASDNYNLAESVSIVLFKQLEK